jgi:phytoene desaturase
VENQQVQGVALTDGQTVPADLVVSNADAANTYRRLMPSVKRKTWTDRKLAGAAYSMGLFVWYFGTNRRYDDLPHHQILMGPRYEGLLRDIFQNKVLSKDFSLYLHRPTATDPSLAPAGCDSFYVLSPVPHLDAGVDWALEAPRYRDAICRQLEDTICPGLSEAIVTSHWMTPPDFEQDYMAYKGAAFGMEPRLLQSAWFRPHNRSEEIEGLFMVGAGTHPGAGIPGVLTSAKAFDAMMPAAHEWDGYGPRAAAGEAPKPRWAKA